MSEEVSSLGAPSLGATLREYVERLRGVAPALVWLAVLLVSMWLFVRQQPGAQLVAYASETVYTVAAVTSGRVDELYVAQDQQVDRGEIVAVLDDSALALRTRGAQAELEQLRAELDRRRVMTGIAAGDALEQHRRFAEDREQAHVAYLRALGDYEESRVRAEGLALEVARLEALDERGLVAASQLNRVRTEHQAIDRRVQEQAPMIDELRLRHAEAVSRHEELLARTDRTAGTGEQYVAPFQWAMRVQEIDLERVALDRSQLALRAPAHGQVEAILARPGEYVRAGTPLLTIVDTHPSELIAYVDAQVQERLVAGAEVVVRRLADRRDARSRVLRRGPRLVPAPVREGAAAVGGAQRYALPVIIAMPPGFAALPGEPFSVRVLTR